MIAQNIAELRERAKLTQEALANTIGVSRQTIAKWESGDATPDLNHARALAQLFDVRLDDLVNHSEANEGYPVPPAGLHIFGIARMGERGQIVIPKKARDIFGLDTGSELLILGDESQGIALQRIEDAEALLEHFARAINASPTHQQEGRI